MLQSLLVSLQETECAALAALSLSPREKMLLDHYFSGGTKATLNELCQRENITRNYIYKLERSLLELIYECLRLHGYDILLFLFERRLYSIFVHYCKFHEERLLKIQADRSILNEFYNKCFDYLIHFEQVENIDLQLIRDYGLKYGKSCEKPIIDHRLQISAVLLGLQLVLINSEKRLTLDKKIAKAEALLIKDQARYYRTKNVKAKYYFYLARSRYYSSYRQDKLDTLLLVLGKAESIITTYPDEFTEVERTYFALRMGRVYLIYNQHQKSYEVFKSVYDVTENWKQYGIPNYLGYVRSLIQVDKYDIAFEALHGASHAILTSGAKIFEVALELLYAEIMLHTEKYERSLYHIQKAKSLMQGKVYYHNYDISLRVTETTIAFLMKRWEDADDLIDRNLKWFKDNKEDSENASVVFLRLLRMLIEKKYTGKAIPKRYLEYLKNEHSPLRAFPKSILDKLVYQIG
jgi:hypothetical protein